MPAMSDYLNAPCRTEAEMLADRSLPALFSAALRGVPEPDDFRVSHGLTRGVALLVYDGKTYRLTLEAMPAYIDHDGGEM